MPSNAYDTKQRHPGAVALFVLLIVLAVAMMIISNTVFAVRSVSVEGNRFCSEEEVVASAGIRLGESMFAIDSKKARDGINANRYLRYVGMWRNFPSHVTLRVEENAPLATIMSMGMLVMIGKDSVVLEESAYIDMLLRIPTITGAQVDKVRVGSPVVYAQAGQAEAIEEILGTLENMDALDEVSELNVSALDNLYLVTEDGLQVVLGGRENMGEKISLMMSLLPGLRGSLEIRGGVLDVTTGVSGDFRPPKGAPIK
ncbi:MAG: FtsQ-type POTRA domain-containing protein [Firmicutes bacterium]|nr:FtsQ-type POTRA domain-containing protein [Bacillota bacterium]